MITNAVRSAEKTRKSTCSFADRCGALSIEEFKRRCPLHMENAYQQTVLATIIVENRITSTLRVVAMGVGTKFMSTYHCNDLGDPTPKHLFCVRDCHAEILARRAFLLYMYKEMECLLQDRLSNRESGLGDTSILEWTPTCDASTFTPPFQVRDSMHIHMYTSSMPCGNACIKRWAKGQAVVTLPLESWQYPVSDHSRLHVTAAEQGQVSLLVKKGSAVLPCTCCGASRGGNGLGAAGMSTEKGGMKRSIDIMTNEHPQQEGEGEGGGEGNQCIQANDKLAQGLVYPPGTYPAEACPTGEMGRIMTCSDKIAVWNAVGIQGALLSHWLQHPLYLTSITIGRKFSDPHARRALCCRLQDFSYIHSSPPAQSDSSSSIACDEYKARGGVGWGEGMINPSYSAHHPTLMCTALKLDEKVIRTSAGRPAAIVAPAAAEDAAMPGGAPSGQANAFVVTAGEENSRSQDHVVTDMTTECPPSCETPLTKGVGGGEDMEETIGASFHEHRCLYWSASPPTRVSGRDSVEQPIVTTNLDRVNTSSIVGEDQLDKAVVIDSGTGLLWDHVPEPRTGAYDSWVGNSGNHSTNTVENKVVHAAAEISSALLLVRYQTCVNLLRLIEAKEVSFVEQRVQQEIQADCMHCVDQLSIEKYVVAKRGHEDCPFSRAKDELLLRKRKGDKFGTWIRTTAPT